MKLKNLILALGATAGLTFVAGAAQAASIGALVNANPNFIIEDDSAEIQNVDQGPSVACPTCAIGVLDVGDTLRGIVEFPTLVNANTLQDFDLDGVANSHLSAVFEVEVISKTLSAVQNPNTPGLDFDFVFGPNAAFAAALGVPAGTMVAFYEDDVDDVATGGVFPPADGPCTVAIGGDCELNVRNGTLILALGFSATEFDEAWVAFGAPETPGDAAGVAPGSSIGEFNFQLDVLLSAIGGFAESQDTFIDGLPGGNNKIAWIGSGGVQGTLGVTTPFDIRDDAQLQASIPEPGTLSLLGAGLVVLAGFASRRFRKAA